MMSPNKQKRKRNTKCQPQVQQDPFASYTAELQVEFFKKVTGCDMGGAHFIGAWNHF